MHKHGWFVGILLVASAAQSEPGVVLHQTHEFSATGRVDTLRTYITARHVRIEHKDGDAILDLEKGRLVLLDGHQKTWRQMPLEEWEAAIEKAATTMGRTGTQGEDTNEPGPRPSPAFERIGSPVERAGYLCDRWGLYSQRELIPGAVDWVEQQIWVARELTMPQGAYEAYDRAIRAIDSIGMGGVVKRPEGIVLASEIRIGSAAEHEKGDVEVETLTVYRVERRQLEDVVFQVPPAYVPALRVDSQEGD